MAPTKLILYRRSNGVYYIEYQDKGRKRYKSTGSKTKADALRVLTEFGRYTKARTHSPILSEFIGQFLPYAKSIYSPGTVTIYTSALREFQSAVGDLPLSAISAKHSDQFKVTRLAATSPPTMNID